LLGGFAFLVASAVIIWHLARVTRLSFETIVGAIFTLALAVGILMIREVEALTEALFGDIATVTYVQAIAAVVISIASIFLTRIIYNKIVLSMISEELATSSGVNVARTNLLFLSLVSLVVAIGIKITGTLLVGFLVVVPAAAARNLSSNLFRYYVLSAAFGAISASTGVLLSGYSGLPGGPLVVLSGVTLFIATVIIRWATKFRAL